MDFSRIPLRGNGGLIDVLRNIPDPRKTRGVRYKSESILSVCVCAILNGARSVSAIAQWAHTLDRKALRKLGIVRRRSPSESAIRKFLARIDGDCADQLIGEWLFAQSGVEDPVIAIDGKTLRGSQANGNRCHLLSALLHEAGITIAQTEVDQKSNEITAVRPLLSNVDISGGVVSLDAMHTQKDTAEYIVQEKKADYIMTVKNNQKHLRESIEEFGSLSFSPCVHRIRQGSRTH